MKDTKLKDYIVTVMAQDRVGIVRDVSSALAELGGNITHLSQTVVRGHFTLIISVEMPHDFQQHKVRQAVECRGSAGEFDVCVRPYVQPSYSSQVPSEPFILCMRGKDRPGIIARTTSYLASCEVNIDDFCSYVHEGALLMMARISIPVGLNVEEMRAELEKVGAEFDLVVQFQHENIFRATGEVRPVRDLQRENGCNVRTIYYRP